MLLLLLYRNVFAYVMIHVDVLRIKYIVDTKKNTYLRGLLQPRPLMRVISGFAYPCVATSKKIIPVKSTILSGDAGR